jgi:hypothetical protein
VLHAPLTRPESPASDSIDPRPAPAILVTQDPSATLAVHCGNDFNVGFSPYQSTRLSRYNVGP